MSSRRKLKKPWKGGIFSDEDVTGPTTSLGGVKAEDSCSL